MVKLYYCRIPEKLDEEIIPFFSEYRKVKLATITSPKAKRQGICAELLLEKAVEEYYQRPLPIAVDSNGKPYFEDSKLHFNISHSGDWVACAIADMEVGLDIQVISEYNPKLCKRFFVDKEIEYILASENKDSAFTEIWCKKEARLKSNGMGLKGGLNSFSVFENESEYSSGCVSGFHYSVCGPSLDKINLILEEIKLL